MKFSTTIAAVTLALVGPTRVAAWPGMAQTVKTLQQRARQSNSSDSFELIGDLTHLSPVDLTPVGSRVRNILTGHESAESDEIKYSVPPLNSVPCAQDTCCVWWYIVDEMVRLFSSPSGRCTNPARGAIRLGFHDAAGWSKSRGKGGGADGSIVLAPEERNRPLNKGLEEIIKRVEGWHQRWGGYGISIADLIQMAATVGTVVCPLYVVSVSPPPPPRQHH
jgi:manganese peroxidase